MKFNRGLALAALSALALAACDAAETPSSATVEALPPSEASSAAVSCMASLALQSGAITSGVAQGDVTALDAASAAYRRVAERDFTPDELAQFFASSVAVFDDTPPEQLATEAAACVANAPAS